MYYEIIVAKEAGIDGTDSDYFTEDDLKESEEEKEE